MDGLESTTRQLAEEGDMFLPLGFRCLIRPAFSSSYIICICTNTFYGLILEAWLETLQRLKEKEFSLFTAVRSPINTFL